MAGLDTQQVLPANNPLEIEQAVTDLLTAMRPQQTGGYIFAAAHNLQDDVPASAVVKMFQSVRQLSSSTTGEEQSAG